MIKFWLLSTCLVFLAACDRSGVDGQLRPEVEQLQAEALQSDLAWSLLHALTTEVGPRMAGSEGDPLAVEWARSIMDSMGFDKVWTEPVSFPRWRRGAENAWLVTSYRLPLAVTALGGSPGTGGSIRGEVVQFVNLQALSEAPAEQVEGKIVFISDRMQPSKDGND